MEMEKYVPKETYSVMNTLAILYLAYVIHVPLQVIGEVKEIISNFLWDGKPTKNVYNIIIQSIKNGRLNLE